MEKLAHTYTETIADGISFDMILVQGGEFDMGNKEGDAEKYELPVHKVKVPSLYIGKYLVTQELWTAIMKENPSTDKGEKRPVETVSWNDAKEFIKKLNEQTGKEYRLPTEAEWEFAARGGVHSEGYLYAGSDKLKEVGWYEENSNPETNRVGLKMPNELGIYDMSGNVYEWCEDDYHDNYKGAPTNGSAWIDLPERGSDRVLRGGGWGSLARGCRVSYRSDDGPDLRGNGIGFRLVCSPSSTEEKEK